MEEFIISGYIPYTGVQLTFTMYAVTVSTIAALWFLWSLDTHLKHPEPMLPPTISSEY